MNINITVPKKCANLSVAHLGFLRIKKMFPGQPAASCGKLQIGDIVLEVNGKDMRGVTHQEAINQIRMGPQEVRLLVKRDPSSIPPSLLQRSGSNASDVDPAQILADIQNKLKTDQSSSVSMRSSTSSTKEQSSPRDEVVKVQEASISEAPVSLRSSLMANEPVKYPYTSESNHPSLGNRLSEPVMQGKKDHHTRLAPTNSLPNVISVISSESPKINRQAAIQQNEEDEDADVSSLGDAPLAEDESSDVEDSRRASSIDIIPPDRSIYDEESVKELMGKLSSIESTTETAGEPDLKESAQESVVNSEPPLPFEASASSSSSESESEESDVEEALMSAKRELTSATTSGVEDDKEPVSMTPQEEVTAFCTHMYM